ncbi:MAG: hypothetical protein PHP98_05980 [Kiritimatiellae bacterium]|nr:hypothetical protein [Kiritimatiellia bacterium]
MNQKNNDRPAGMQNIGMQFELAKDRQALCCMINENSGNQELSAQVRELGDFIREISGAEIPVVENDTGMEMPAILIGLLDQSALIRDILRNDEILISGAEEKKYKMAVLSALTLFPSDMGEQGFLVYGAQYNGKSALIITANAEQGLSYAVETIKNRIYEDNGTWQIFGIGTRFLPVLNRPAFKHRSIAAFLSGPCYIYPGQWEKEFKGGYKEFIDWMSGHKLNHLLDWSFTLDAGIGFKSARHPELVNELHPNVRNEYMPDMLAYAQKKHVKTWLFFKVPFRDYAMDKSCAESRSHQIDLETKLMDQVIIPCVKTPCFDPDKMDGGMIRWVCLSNADTKKFWEEYIREIVSRYPLLDGIGCEMGEHMDHYCQCPKCKGRELELGYEYFKIMADTARKIKPDMKLWFYRAAGAELIAKRRGEFGDITMIGWGYTELWNLRRSAPREDWFLCHTGADEEILEEYLRKAINSLSRNAIAGVQIRGLKYEEWRHRLRAYEEFAWNPDMTLEDFALLNIIREDRKIDPAAVQIYLNWMRYLDADNTLKFKVRRLPAEWLDTENIAEILEKAKSALEDLFKDYYGNSKIIEKIKAGIKSLEFLKWQAEHSYNLIAGSDFPVVVKADKTSVPWEGILILRNGCFAEKEVPLCAGKYEIEAVLKCFTAAACKVQLLLNGKVEAVFPVEPIDSDNKSSNGWSVPSAQIKIHKEGLYNFRIQLAEGDNCAFHRLKVTIIEQ